MLPAHLPQGILFLGKDFKVLFCKLDRGQCLQAKVGPALHKLDQALKSVQSQTVIPIVGQVGHEDADLKIGKTVYSTAVMKNERNVVLARQEELQRGRTHTSHHPHTTPQGS